jgi:hypothetical protein
MRWLFLFAALGVAGCSRSCDGPYVAAETQFVAMPTGR